MRITQQRMAEIMNKGRFGDQTSKRVDLALSLLILANLIAVCLESVDSIAAVYGPQLFAFEMISVTIFAAEYASCVCGPHRCKPTSTETLRPVSG